MANMLSHLKTLIPDTARANIGRSIRNFRRKPAESQGVDFIGELRSRLPDMNVKTIFDVGAHIGISALEYSDSFSDALIYAFEPSSDNFERMKLNLVGKPDIKMHRIGMGAERSKATLYLDPNHPSMARLTKYSDGSPETITLDTIDSFCNEHHIPTIDILKIDTEGHELQVLHGAGRMLKDSKISIIKAEVAIDPDSSYHTQLFGVCSFLHPLGYRIFGFYDQFQDTINGGPRIRRFDVAFLAAK